MATRHMDAATAAKVRAAQAYQGRPPSQPIGYEGTIGSLLEERAAAHRNDVYLISYDEAGQRSELTYGELVRTVRRWAGFLTGPLGLKPGSRIGSMAHNHRDTILLYFAAWMAGVTVVPVNVGEDDERVVFIANNAGCAVLFARSDYLERVARLRPRFESVGSVIQVDGPAAHPAADEFLPDRLADMPARFDAAASLDRNQEALIVYTSGTTGPPKGVLLNQYNILTDAAGIATWHGLDATQRTMCVLPIHHVNGIVVTHVVPLLVGGSTVLNRAFSPRWFWERLAAERVQIVSVVPTLLAYLIEAEQSHGGYSDHDLAAFRHFICGAGPLTVQLAAQFEDLFDQRIVHGYGLSETTCYSTFLPVDLDAEGHRHWMRAYGYPSIGPAIPPNELTIHSPEGKSLPFGPEHKGEIVVRGHNVMQGYFQRPDANAATFAHGWFRTGDEGFAVGDDGGRPYFFITGRIKELIIRGGVNYSPFEIDEVLCAMPGVRVGLAVGFPNKYYGEEVGAYIVTDEGVALTPESVLDYARDHLPLDKCPKVVVFGTEIPVTSTGKYQRLRLAPLFADYQNHQFRAD